MVHSASRSEPDPADVMPTFLPASSAAVVIFEFGRHHQVPAEIAERPAGHQLRGDALAQPRRDQRRRVEDEVGGAGGQRLEAFGAAAIDRQLGADALALEQLLPDRRLGDDRRPVGLGRQADAHGVLGQRRGGGRQRDGDSEGRGRQDASKRPRNSSAKLRPHDGAPPIDRWRARYTLAMRPRKNGRAMREARWLHARLGGLRPIAGLSHMTCEARRGREFTLPPVGGEGRPAEAQRRPVGVGGLLLAPNLRPDPPPHPSPPQERDAHVLVRQSDSG